MSSSIKDLAITLTPRLIEIRRHLHSHPELSGQEHQTAAYVAGVLSSCGLHIREAVGKVGVVGELSGQGQDDRILAIRTDMDALPIQERTGLDFASRTSGVMHACGHDVHTTVGLGTAMVLSQLRKPLPEIFGFCFNRRKRWLRAHNGWSKMASWSESMQFFQSMCFRRLWRVKWGFAMGRSLPLPMIWK